MTLQGILMKKRLVMWMFCLAWCKGTAFSYWQWKSWIISSLSEHSCIYIEIGNGRQEYIVYPECVANHYTYADSVNANIRVQMYPIAALQDVWKTA